MSNYEIADLEKLLDSAKVKPVANQILLHPYVWERQAPLVAFCQKNGIVVEAYSALTCVSPFYCLSHCPAHCL